MAQLVELQGHPDALDVVIYRDVPDWSDHQVLDLGEIRPHELKGGEA